MKTLVKTLLLITGLVMAACSREGGGMFGGDSGAGYDAVLPDDGGVTPESVAYFQSTIGDRVLFAVDQSTLSPEGRTLLADQADWLLQNVGYSAIVEGHADEQGTREYNLALGARRASTVREFLISRGVSAARLRSVSYGKERPIELCSDEICYRQNRRAVTVLSAGLSG
ncbi:MAG: peptidoglycan-associated lipoprotein Pal [Pseudomonadota bacterium]